MRMCRSTAIAMGHPLELPSYYLRVFMGLHPPQHTTIWREMVENRADTIDSIHPSSPELMFWALIAPELMVLWAMKQWYAARAMVAKYHGSGWTKTHGYFIQMGGFTLFEGGNPKEVLLPYDMKRLLLEGRIAFPQITEEEIRDRSKGDGLSKALVIGQTSWFIAQCIARRAQGLILTELELVTAAFAALNGVMYFLWWNKPLDVRCSVPVHLLDEAKPVQERFTFKSTEKSDITRWPWNELISKPRVVLASLVTWISKIKDINFKILLNAGTSIIIFPWKATQAFFSRLSDIADVNPTSRTLKVTGSVSTVLTFYASLNYTSSMTNQLLIPSVTLIIAASFGALHCVGWSFSFPSHAELLIWRICSTVISIIPLGVLLFFIFMFCASHTESDSISEKFFEILWGIFAIAVFCLPVYVIARLLLLGEAFAALRYLSPDALAVVDWLSFLPHI